MPAFLVYSSERTMVVPIDGSEPRTVDGIWIASTDRPRTVPCACGTIDRACIEREMTRTIEVNDGFAVEWEGPLMLVALHLTRQDDRDLQRRGMELFEMVLSKGSWHARQALDAVDRSLGRGG